jgi:hypothetical protein
MTAEVGVILRLQPDSSTDFAYRGTPDPPQGSFLFPSHRPGPPTRHVHPVLHCASTRTIRVGRLGTVYLRSGCYLVVGSAFGRKTAGHR